MKNKQSLIPVERIEKSILLIGGQKVMMDSDLAKLYGVETKELNVGKDKIRIMLIYLKRDKNATQKRV